MLCMLRELSRHYDIRIISRGSWKTKESSLRNDFCEETIVRDNIITAVVNKAIGLVLGVDATDLIRRYDPLTDFARVGAPAIAGADLVMCIRPYACGMARIGGKPLITDCHDVEVDVRRQLTPPGPLKGAYIGKVMQLEREACGRSDVLLTVTEADSEALSRIYGVGKEKIVVAPNGLYLGEGVSREEARRRLGIGPDSKMAVFIGSSYKPNVEGLAFIASIAAKAPDVRFIAIGDVGGAYRGEKPPNLALLGRLEEEDKDLYLAASDIALNPIFAGSGSNMKVADYLSFSLPVLSSRVGARGWDLGEDLIADGEGEFLSKLRALLAMRDRSALEKRMRGLAESHQWAIIAGKVQERLARL